MVPQNGLFSLLCLVLSFASLVHSASRVKIENNGYTNLVIAFHPDTPAHQSDQLIQNLKSLFIKGSNALYTATRKRSYFKEVTIFVPQSWPKKAEYQIPTFENFADADIQVKPSNPLYGDEPYTLQSMGCGRPGKFIHLTQDYLQQLNQNSTVNYGDPGKTLVREWAHYRYGIFSERPDPLMPFYSQFYYDGDFKQYMPNACTNQDLVGKKWNPKAQRECSLNYDGNPEPDCVFIVDPVKNTATSSIASLHNLPHVETFCDETEEFLHNRLAPNMQNRMCNGKSTWSVIVDHEDFKTKNQPAVISKTEPIFKIVQEEDQTYALVLDISSSMNMPAGYTKLHMLQEAATRWVKEAVPIGSAVGIVTFSTNATLDLPIVKIENEAIRKKVISKVPVFAGGYTCIGCGIITAVRDLRRFRKGKGGIIILLSDGEENRHPNVSSVLKEVVDANIKVVTIAFTAEASAELERLAQSTGGKAYFVPEAESVIKLDSAFFEISSQQAKDEDQNAKVKEVRHQNSTEAFNGEFTIDNTIGRDTTINFLYNNKSDINDIKVTGPGIGTVSMKDKSTDAVTIELNDKEKQIRFVFELLKDAIYKYVVDRKGSENQDMTINVLSKSKNETQDAIVVECNVVEEKNTSPPRFLILVEVKMGSKPVVNAKVTVKIDRPDSSSVTMELFDNGRKGDITPNDGVYSGYLTQLSGSGRYSVQAHVVATDKTAVLERGSSSNVFIPHIIEVKTGTFERVAAAGSIQITQQPGKSDVYPPSPIRDLRVLSISPDNSKVVLQWSAPGDDLDNGQASKYELRYTMNYDALRDSFFGQQYDQVSTPLSAGSIENLTVNMKGLGGEVVYYAAIKAKDKTDNWSEISNIVQIHGH